MNKHIIIITILLFASNSTQILSGKRKLALGVQPQSEQSSVKVQRPLPRPISPIERIIFEYRKIQVDCKK